MCSARATTFLADCWVSPSTTRTSSCLAVIFRIPAWSWREPSLLTDRTVAWVPIFTSSTVSPARAGGVGGRGLLRPGPQLPLRLVEARRRAARSSLTLLPVFLFPLAAAHVVELLEYLVGGVPGLVQNGPGLRLGLLHRLARSASILALYSREALAVSSISRRSRAAASFLPLHLLAPLVQLGEHVLEADILRVDAGGGLLDDGLGQAQPLRKWQRRWTCRGCR